jgi:hypothetical protein
MYFVDLSSHDCCLLVDELDIYIDAMKRSPFPLVYLLMTLALTLPVEIFFSAINIIKSDLQDKMGDDLLSDLMTKWGILIIR